MKIIKLFEASSAVISGWKGLWNDPDSDKLDVVFTMLIDPSINLKADTIKKIQSFGESFVIDWVNAMKIDEIGYDGNEFIKFIKTFENQNDPYFLRNKENFSKVYNVYVKGDLDTNLFEDKVYKQLLLDGRMYQYNLDEFTNIFNDFIDLYDKGCRDSDLKYIFIDKNNQVRQPAEIQAKKQQWLSKNNKNINVKKERNTNSNNKDYTYDDIDNILENPDFVDYIENKFTEKGA